MLQLNGQTRFVCDGLSRREILSAGGAGLLGLNLQRVLAAEDAAAAAIATDASGAASAFGNTAGRAKSVIFLFLFGGPSQLETFDMKPDAPAGIRGPFKPIASRTPELRLCEHLPKTAAVSDKFCVVRTMTHPYNDHSGGGHYIQTGQKWNIPIGGGFNATPKDWPSMGSVVGYETERRAVRDRAARSDLPAYVVVPNFLGRLQDYRVQLVRPGQYAGWLGRGYDPVNTRIEKRDAKDNPYFRDCTDEELNFQIDGLNTQDSLTLDRLNRRRSLLEQFDEGRRSLDGHASTAVYDRFQQRAMSLVTSDRTRAALDVRREPDALRDRYGRHLFGQSAMMARRLVEAGVRFVTVHYDCVDGYSWDSHRSSSYLEKHLIPTLDDALSALLTDLEERGLLDETLVVAMGEMGRTPKAAAPWGRGHWSTLFPSVLAGAGVRGGTLYGSSDKDAAYPADRPVSPEDLAATIYHALGIDPHLRLPDPQGRPTPIVENGLPLLDVFG